MSAPGPTLLTYLLLGGATLLNAGMAVYRAREAQTFGREHISRWVCWFCAAMHALSAALFVVAWALGEWDR